MTKSMTDHFLDAYYKGRLVRRLRNFVLSAIVTLTAFLLTWFCSGFGTSASLIDVAIIPGILGLLGMLVGVSRKPQFLFPFWAIVGFLLAASLRVIILQWL
jgi:hypothetical protein